MVKHNFILLFIVLMSSLFFSCDDSKVDIVNVISCEDGVKNGDETGIDCGGSCPEICPPENAIQGEVVSILELTSENEYILNGPLLIRDGGQLIIQEGTIIRAQKNRNAYIAIAQGGKLFVYGRENNPVTITSNAENPEPGDWGGILLFGKAPINSADVGRSDLLDYFYGGDDPDDSSGFIRYLRVEYSGASYDGELNFDGITLYGIGQFTTLNYVQVANSLGNGFRTVGGTVAPELILATNNMKSGVVLSDGWQGSGNSWLITNSNTASVEIFNNKLNPLAEPVTSGQLSDMSFIGPSSIAGIYYYDGGGEVTMSNIYSGGLDVGIQVDGATATMKIDAGDLFINPIEFDATNPGFIKTNYTGPNNFFMEGLNLGAGNRGEIPTWASPWILEF